jgi:hypothetical protein
VVARAGKLKTCTADSDCKDPNFNQCVKTNDADETGFCQHTIAPASAELSIADRVKYPAADLNAQGLVDVSHNTFNGDKNEWSLNTEVLGRADGPQTQSKQPSFNLNSESISFQGDDIVWYFYVNRNVDLTAPVITDIKPTVGQSAISLTAPMTADFNKVMMGSTIKPDSGYRDGMCRCSIKDDKIKGTCLAGYICEVKPGVPEDFGKCVADKDTERSFCALNEDCPGYDGDSAMCINKKYVSLLDKSSSPVGWWITHQDLDTVSPLDTFSDISRAYVNHTPLSEVTNYSTEIGSGVKDVYQNCFLPSKGPLVNHCDPKTDANCCPVTATKPFCCNGRVLPRASVDPRVDTWETSECNTGY